MELGIRSLLGFRCSGPAISRCRSGLASVDLNIQVCSGCSAFRGCFDAAGQLLRVRNGLISPRRLHSEMSQDWQEIATETIEDNAFAIRQALATAREIEGETGEKIHWRELLALPMPEGVQITAPITVGSPGGNNEGNTNE